MQVFATACWGLQRTTEIMDSHSLILPESAAREAHECLHLHLRAYLWLASFHYHQRELLFKVRPKTHYLHHLADDIFQYRLNPVLWHTFSEEHFLGRVKAIAVRCHGATCTSRLFLRYILCLAVCLEDFKKLETSLG